MGSPVKARLRSEAPSSMRVARFWLLQWSEQVKNNQRRENAQGEGQGEEYHVQLESASADGPQHITSPDAGQQEEMPKMILPHFCGVTKLGELRWCCSDGSY